MVDVIEPGVVEQEDPDVLLRQLESSRKGLSEEEAQARLQRFGANALEEERVSPLHKFLGYFWGPIPWMIEVAAVLSVIVQHWDDFAIIAVLLIFNAAVGFWQEFKRPTLWMRSNSSSPSRPVSSALGNGERSPPGNWCRATSSACAWATSFPPMRSCWKATT